MLTLEAIKEVVEAQNELWVLKQEGVLRDKLKETQLQEGFVNIITGIRRCGKSTLMRQLLTLIKGKSLFLNFEDPRLSGFDISDFRRLDILMKETKVKNLFFDEIQICNGWELYVRQKLDEGYHVVVTGSNAHLLSKELGTKLTGRHLSTTLYPFSYTEYLSFLKKRDSQKAVENYLKDGGFPEFLKSQNPNVLRQLLDDILLRDIAVRYAVRDVSALRQLAVYLITNIGKLVSATNLKTSFGIKATSTLLEYFSYLENAYLVQFIPKFSYSLQKQIRNPKKVYVIDLGLFEHASLAFSEEKGRRLENLIFLQYLQQGKELAYFNEKKECDFIVSEHGKVKEAVQVCHELTPDNLDREIEGLVAALEFLNLKKGKIVTLTQTDEYEFNGKTIEVIPIRTLLNE